MPSTPEPQVWPTLRARDARALIRFLVDAFGFEETVVYGDGDRVDHAQLSWPEGGGIMLGSVRDGDTDAHGQATPDPAGDVRRLRGHRRRGRGVPAGQGGRRRDHRRAARHRLRLARLRRPRPGGEPLVFRDLPGRAPEGPAGPTRSNVPGMRAWHVEAPGPVTGHPLRLHPDDETPRPGPGELLLRVLACGVCRTDLHVTEGDLPPHQPGVTPGHEVVGEVAAVGEGDDGGLQAGRPRGRRLAPLDRQHLQVLPPRRGEPVPGQHRTPAGTPTAATPST